MDLDSFHVASLVRYFVSGLTAITILYVVPCAVDSRILLDSVFSGVGIAIVIALSFVVGFVLDSLKIYRLQFSDIIPTLYQKSYLARKARFMKRFAVALGIPKNVRQAEIYHSLLRQLLPRDVQLDLDRKHSDWTLLESTVRLFTGLVMIWGYHTVYSFINFNQRAYLEHFALLVVTILVDVRISKYARDERRRLDATYIMLASRNSADELDGKLKINRVKAKPKTDSRSTVSRELEATNC